MKRTPLTLLGVGLVFLLVQMGAQSQLKPAPSIELEKSTNLIDADDPNAGDAPLIAIGNLIVWRYQVLNNGNETINNIVVTDDQGVIVTCPTDTLAPGEEMTCTGQGLAEDVTNTAFTTVPGVCGSDQGVLYENVGSLTGISATTNTPIFNFDPSHYCNPPQTVQASLIDGWRFFVLAMILGMVALGWLVARRRGA